MSPQNAECQHEVELTEAEVQTRFSELFSELAVKRANLEKARKILKTQEEMTNSLELEKFEAEKGLSRFIDRHVWKRHLGLNVKPGAVFKSPSKRYRDDEDEDM